MQTTKTSIYIYLTFIFLLSTSFAKAQCEVYKSEINEVTTHMNTVSVLIDSVKTMAEIAAFEGNTRVARFNAKKVEALIGKALSAAEDAVYIVSEAQYNSELCGISAVKSSTVDTESRTIDAHDFLSEAYINAKKAITAKNLGNIQYHMRKYQTYSRDAQNAALDASYASELANNSCTHAGNTTASIEK